MADYAGAEAAIEAHLTSGWTATPIVFANAAPEGVIDGTTGAPASAWVYAEIGLIPRVGTGADEVTGFGTPGNSEQMQLGSIDLHVFAPVMTGRSAALAHAVALGELFRDRTLYAATPGYLIRCQKPRVDGGGRGSEDGLWYRRTVSIGFEYWHRG
jgi:hypothetical protein